MKSTKGTKNKRHTDKEMEGLLEYAGSRTIKTDSAADLYFDVVGSTNEIIVSRGEHCLAVFSTSELRAADVYYENLRKKFHKENYY